MNKEDIQKLIEETIKKQLRSFSNFTVPQHHHNKVDSPAVISDNIQITSNGFMYSGSINFTPISAATVTIGGGQVIKKAISSVAALNFGAIAPNTAADLTMSLTGAKIGDSVILGVADTVISAGVNCADITFFAWVSALNTVTIRCLNGSAVNTANPASGNFRSSIIQF